MSEQKNIQALMEIMNKLKRLNHFNVRVGGLNHGEFSLLMSICEENAKEEAEVKVSRLAKRCSISPPAISQMLTVLENKGLISRALSQKDRRVVFIRITPKGQEMLDHASCHFQSFLTLIAEKLGEKDTQTLIELFSRLYDIMKDLHDADFLETRETEQGGQE